jgi:hypothetical protein
MNSTNTAPEIVATLKAEFVNEFEFTPRREKVRRFSDETQITHPYTREYEAKVSVKVGNAVKELTFRENEYYKSSYRDEAGEYHSGVTYKYLGLKENTHPFQELENAGIAVDYSEVLFQYVKLVEEAKYRETLIERYNTWENIRRAKKRLAESWIHNFEATIRADRNKRIQAAVQLTTFAPSTDYNKKHHINITYKGVTVPIHIVDGSFAFNNEKYEWGFKPYMENSDNKVELADDKLRRAKREGTLFLKAIEAIDIREANVAYRNKQREEEIAHNKKVGKILRKAAGVPVMFKEEQEWSRRDDRSYRVARYHVLVESNESSYDVAEKIEIKYSSYNDGQFTVKGLTLREDQFKKVLDILIDGRKVFTKEEYEKAKAELEAKREAERIKREKEWEEEQKKRIAEENKN